MPTKSTSNQPPAEPINPPGNPPAEPVTPEGQSSTELSTGTNLTAGASAGQTPAEAKFTQADIDQIAGKTRKEAATAAQAKLLKELGFESADAAKAAFVEADKIRKAQMTDQERLTQEKADAEKRADDATAAAKLSDQARQQALIESEIVSMASGKFANPKAMVKLVDQSKVKFEDGNIVGVAEELARLETSEPWTLLPKAGSPQSIGRTNPSGTPPGRTDKDRKQEYFGGGRATFFKGGGVSKVIETEEGG